MILRLVIRKVFTHFLKNYFMNKLKIGIPILAIITIAIIVSLVQQEIVVKEIDQVVVEEIDQVVVEEIDQVVQEGIDQVVVEEDISIADEIKQRLMTIEEDKKNNDESVNPYKIREREWPESGPFKIDRTEYWLGEKIFVNISGLSENDFGNVKFHRPISSTDYVVYHSMPFDGAQKRNNYYLTPQLSELMGICSIEQLTGNWKVSFEGTNYSDLKFKVLENILPGAEDKYQTIVNKGKC